MYICKRCLEIVTAPFRSAPHAAMLTLKSWGGGYEKLQFRDQCSASVGSLDAA